MSTKLYLYNEIVYEGELGDIEAVLAAQTGTHLI